MKKIKYFIIIFIIIIILLVIGLIIMLQSKKQPKQIEKQPEEQEIEEQEYSSVTDAEKVFNIANDITSYLTIINQNNSSYYRTNEAGQREKIVTDETIQNNIYNILSEKYIKENNITKENVLQYVPKLEANILYVPTQMEMKKDNNIETYLTKGFIEDIQYNFISEIYLIVNYDEQNKTFSIEPVSNQTKSLDELEKETTIKTIEEKENNKHIENTVNDQYIATQYMYLYKRMALSKPELAYEHLENDYKEKRFGTLEEFTKYVEANRKEIQSLILSKYKMEDKKVICQDKFENTYTFDITGGVLDYTIKLDSYTIPSEEFTKTYNSASEENKVAINTEKVIQMMNSRDYKTMYTLLDEEYKNTYFTTLEEFERYMGIVYGKHYKYKISETNKEGETYILKIELTPMENEKALAEQFTLMMQIKEEFNFKISFTYFGG